MSIDQNSLKKFEVSDANSMSGGVWLTILTNNANDSGSILQRLIDERCVLSKIHSKSSMWQTIENSLVYRKQSWVLPSISLPQRRNHHELKQELSRKVHWDFRTIARRYTNWSFDFFTANDRFFLCCQRLFDHKTILTLTETLRIICPRILRKTDLRLFTEILLRKTSKTNDPQSHQ
jgi:hypothetical protein